MEKKKLFVVTGELSGDKHASLVVKSLLENRDDIEIEASAEIEEGNVMNVSKILSSLLTSTLKPLALIAICSSTSNELFSMVGGTKWKNIFNHKEGKSSTNVTLEKREEKAKIPTFASGVSLTRKAGLSPSTCQSS